MQHHPSLLKHYGILGLFFALMTAGLFLFALTPRVDEGKVVVIVSPLSQDNNAAQVIANARGAIVGAGKTAWIAIGQSNSSDFVARLYQAGALFVGSAEAFSACIPANLQTSDGRQLQDMLTASKAIELTIRT